MKKTIVFGVLVLILVALSFWMRKPPESSTQPAPGAETIPETVSKDAAPMIGVTAEPSPELRRDLPITKEPTPVKGREPDFTRQRAEFQTQLKEGLMNMPTKASLKTMTEEQAHHFPPYLKPAGAILGGIAEKIAQDPRYIPQALEFYRECATSPNFPTAVRALCLADYRKHGDDKQAQLPGVPDPVEKLSRRLGAAK